VIRRRVAAAVALLAGAVTIALAVQVAIDGFPRGIAVAACALAAIACALLGFLRAGTTRIAALAAAAVGAAGAIALILTGDHLLAGLAMVGSAAICVLAAQVALRIRVALPSAPAPRAAVLFYNPRSGGGKAERFDLPGEARSRGIEPVELGPGKDLKQLVTEAIAGGADALAMAGGDGSQAVVAAIAAERGLPYACIPAGTRNHFALDLGVDRDDVVGALDAFVEGGERLVDLAEVNGRVFVNNVSLGLYAEAVQKPEYRGAKLRTLLDTVPEVLGPDAKVPPLSWRGPHGRAHESSAAILVSNNRYRLGRPVGSGTRPRIDDGVLGVTVFAEPTAAAEGRRLFQRPWREWSAPSFEIEADRPVPAGIDGEAATLEPPLRFRIVPGVLRVRVAESHPGASPSAIAPDGAPEMVATLARIALGRYESGSAAHS
jgi:diacylglycerol kinase family enzyme